jgi:hypothetical protein
MIRIGNLAKLPTPLKVCNPSPSLMGTNQRSVCEVGCILMEPEGCGASGRDQVFFQLNLLSNK